MANSVKRAISVLGDVLGMDGIVYLVERHPLSSYQRSVTDSGIGTRHNQRTLWKTMRLLQNIQDYIIEPIIHSHGSIEGFRKLTKAL